MDRTANLIHVAFLVSEKGRKSRLYLRKIHDRRYTWFEVDESFNETEAPIWSDTIENALCLAGTYWQRQSFRTLNCGFRYTLPERDEHGINALFWKWI